MKLPKEGTNELSKMILLNRSKAHLSRSESSERFEKDQIGCLLLFNNFLKNGQITFPYFLYIAISGCY